MSMRDKRPKLLVVDDDDAFREAMELEFSDRGYQVLLAPDHRSALGLAAVHRPGFAVIDLRLAGERGLEVLKDLVERLPGVRAVVLGAALDGGGVSLVSVVADTDAFNAAELIADAAKAIKGGGGKGADFAMAGGKDAEALDAALDLARSAAGIA